MTGYEINPFTMVFVSSGTLAYYSQLFHYENYPELVSFTIGLESSSTAYKQIVYFRLIRSI